MKRFPFPLRVSIPFILLVFSSILSVFSFQREVSLSDLRTEEYGRDQARFSGDQTSGTLEYLFRNGDEEGANLVISKLGGNTALQLALLSDENNNINLATRYELRKRLINETEVGKYFSEVEGVRQRIAGRIVLSEDKQSVLAIYPVVLGSVPGEVRPTRVGVLVLKYDLSELKQQAFADAEQRSLEKVAVLSLLCLGAWLFFDNTLTKRAEQLVKATNSLAQGRLDVRTKLSGSDEMAQISFAFDRMAEKIQTAQQELHQLAACRELEAEKLAQALKNLQEAQAQLIQVEKMSSLGQLVAGIAHEINNPVNFIHGNLAHASNYAQDLLALIQLYQSSSDDDIIQEKIDEIDLDFVIKDLPKLLESMRVGTQRIREIVLTLRNFSRLDEADMKPVNIHEGLESTLMILQNQLKAKPDQPEIQVIKEYGNLPEVECYAGQLNQVFMNIINNAIDALHHRDRDRSKEEIKAKPSTIAIATKVLEPDWVSICIKDNGPGIESTAKSKIFDPFFTTKPVGSGTGLGLSISYQIIVEKHNGHIKCISQPGQGSEFWIQIPIQTTCSIPDIVPTFHETCAA